MATTKHLIYSFNGVLIFLITFFTFNSISKEKCNIIELINFFIIYFINFFHLYVNFLICEFLLKYSKSYVVKQTKDFSKDEYIYRVLILSSKV